MSDRLVSWVLDISIIIIAVYSENLYELLNNEDMSNLYKV